jgi:hypothetical protein
MWGEKMFYKKTYDIGAMLYTGYNIGQMIEKVGQDVKTLVTDTEDLIIVINEVVAEIKQ